MKRIIAVVLSLIVASMMLCACSAQTATESKTDKKVVGILMPTKEQTTWVTQGDMLVEEFGKLGYETHIEYAEDDSAKQAMQIENMVSKGCNILVIAAVDCASLTDACEKAKDAGCLVIAEDRLITNTDALDYYVTADLNKIGELQGQYIEKALDLKNATDTKTLEIFSGSPDDTNSEKFYDGAMAVLNPYIDDGKLEVKSGQIEYTQTAIPGWDSAKAQQRMDNILSGYYPDSRLDAVLVAADCLSLGVISSLESMGYGTSDNPFPVVTGQDAELAACKYILDGKQSMTVYLDDKTRVDLIVGVVENLLAGKEVTPDLTYNNGVFDVPTKAYGATAIDKSNVDSLIDKGYFTKEELYNK